MISEDNGTVDIPKGKIIGGSWKVTKKLGEGGCGSVYLVQNLDDESQAAMKVESNFAAGGCVLKLEVAILKKLSGKPHVAQFMGAARVTQYSYMIMTLLGESLNKIFKRMNRSCTVSTQARIGANVLFCLKQVHDIGFIHRDLKPANIALGWKNTSEARFFHVLDFGLARQYVVPSDGPKKLAMRRPRDRALFRGTTRYCSIRMHDRSEQGRVDDLWSMIYMLAELRGPLPWAQQADKRIVGELKRMYTDEVVLQNSPIELLEIAKHLRKLTYFHRPDYVKIYHLFLQIMEKGRFKWDDPYDWEVKKLSKSKEAIRGSVEKTMGSKEVVGSKEEKSKNSRETILSKETIKKSKETTASKENADENLKILPFSTDFFIDDPIGF